MLNDFKESALSIFFGKKIPYSENYLNWEKHAVSPAEAWQEIEGIISNMDKHVTQHKIPKRKESKVRIITAPDEQLKFFHRNINHAIFSKYKPTKYAHGFVRKKGVYTNAVQHAGCRAMAHMDIKNFFDSITTKHVQNALFGSYRLCYYCNNQCDMKAGECSPSLYKNMEGQFPKLCHQLSWFSGNKPEDYKSLVDYISRMVTYKDSTPQGFSTSPFIANIVLRKFDLIIGQRMEKHGIVYTRYADDLTFSHKTESSGFIAKKVLRTVPSTLGLFGFKVNQDKTYFKTNKGRMSSCNVVINKHPNLNRDTRNLLRAKIHHATVKRASETTRADILQLRGEAAYFYMLNKQLGKKYLDQISAFEEKQKTQTALDL